MANATSILINDLVGNSSLIAPTAQVLDTGTAAVTLETPDLVGGMGRVIVEVTNTAAAALTVTAVAGDKPPALRSGLGDVVSGTMAQNVRRIFGPFEPGRFSEGGGKLKLTFTPASGTIGVSFLAYRLPRHP